ncbi:hypothetical protein M404DRAFT_1002474 [Pisolithus tinctorius Marx 270]|uniref:Uncharacterized protein n=1 Tax=Pisolithus tinctorius Marx 270 TaxID=870435 RepID=A0A0C3J046_PISTI|nr:hypothetical protein M404DRAFT_1002474 [Pisolithus tinctorius Marx 270]
MHPWFGHIVFGDLDNHVPHPHDRLLSRANQRQLAEIGISCNPPHALGLTNPTFLTPVQ